MKPGLRILLVEDDTEDSDAIERELLGSGLDVRVMHTRSEAEFEHALDQADWHAVLFDYMLPGTTWQRCLELTRHHDTHLPFIVVSGKKGEEHVVETVRGGCSDYVVKDRLVRLTPVLEREVRLAESQREAHLFRKRITSQLARAARAEVMGVLAAGIAHNLNNLLTLTLAGLSDVPNRRPDKEDLVTALKATEKAAELIRQLLSIGRPSGGKQSVTSVGPLLERVANLVRGSLPDGIRIAMGQVDAPDIQVEVSALEQAVTNLILNARDALGNTGRITLSTTAIAVPDDGSLRAAPGQYVRIAVADDGPGISPEHLDRVFDPFFTTKGQIGTGLGLATVASFARAHHGWAAAESVLGQGAEFVIVLPVERLTPANP